MSTSQIRVIAGLGNPGKKYELTRHNVGFLIAEEIARSWEWSFKENREFQIKAAKGQRGEITVHLLMPMTYMNESGRAIRRYLDFYKLKPEQLLVIVDDVTLPFPQMRLKASGSSGGHNGLKNIELHLGTQHYARLRMGVGSALAKERELADFVLDTFSDEEKKELPSFIKCGATAVERLTKESFAPVMNNVNIKVRTPIRSGEKHESNE